MQGMKIARVVAAALVGLWISGCDSTPPGMDAGTHDSGPTLLGAGAVCAQNSDCFLMACKTHCCGFSCSNDATCGVTSCDTTGACVYPSGNSCGTQSCDSSLSQLTTSTCLLGTCVAASPQACNDHLGCADASVCNTTCATASDCAAHSYCYDAGCSPLGTAGSPCPLDAGCLSGYCGASDAGPALCCTAGCHATDPTCGATGCNGRGDCLYPSNLTPCAVASCVGDLETQPASCDGNGSCPAATAHCAPYVCGTNSKCLTSCATTADCFGGFCDGPSNQCCPSFIGNTVFVDGTAGVSGQACCGRTAGAGACAFLADAVRLAGESKTSGMILSVASAPKDFVAVQLSYGVVVQAPGVTLPPLRIARFPADTSTSVIVEGTAAMPVDLSGAAGSQVVINDSMTLYLWNATLGNQGSQPMVQVNAGGALKLGSDGVSNSGTVTFDIPAGGFGSSGTAIACKGTAAAPASVDDVGAAAGTSLRIQNTNNHLVIGDYCTVNLTDNPVFGAAAPCGQFNQFTDQTGLQVDGAATVTISNATFQCFQKNAIVMQNTGAAGAPTVGGSFNTIKKSGTGVQCKAGTFSMIGTTITGNGNGLVEADDTSHHTTGIVDLSGGGNKVYCNGNGLAMPGADVLNLTADAGLNAKRVAWDAWDPDAGHTELWSCDPTFMTCTCTGAASCSLYTSLETDADAVTTNGILVDDTGGSLVAGACQ
jgi:hypothetical protein